MGLADDALLPGERVVLTKRANAIVRASDYGLGHFPFGKYMSVVGMSGREGIGGEVHLTSSRLIFKSHALNRLKGTFSIFLPSINTARDTSQLVMRKVLIETKSQNYEFIMWGIGEFLAALESQRARLAGIGKEQLIQSIAERPGVIEDGLSASPSVDRLISGSATLLNVLNEMGHAPALVTSLINLADLLSH